MKFIPGYTFTVGEQPKPKSGSVQLVPLRSRSSTFTEKGEYRIDMIAPKPEGVTYTFRKPDGNIMVQQFSTIEEAENLITKAQTNA